ncbi:LysR family transcriptional regulator [Novosphingobium sp. TH158]|uniref:LysR family transcriptional regulator n=1 Tax=Novosphingobium sp. TH158 TaxID=2067455 RepID=UPI000C7C90E2|nr:LysR family transcriptional regulator [Novosphingobium sp. TH158]PLK25756.1 LysR family transcriptional regulator [Novosphingobium sp. TH158]
MIKRTHLRQFLAVVDTGNFTRAAERVGVAQPSLSAGIAELERLAGARLFVRERRRIRLTDAGNRLLAHARAIEREFRQAEASLSASAPVAPPMRVGVLASLATDLIARIAAAWSGERALVLVEGTDADLRKRLSEGQVDAVVTLLRTEDRERPALELFDEGYVLMLHEGHALAGAELLTAADVAGETMIARRSCEILGDTSRWFTRRGVRPPFFLRSANDDRCMEMVRMGMGVTTAPESLARPGVRAIPLSGYDFRRSVGVLLPRGFAGEPADHPLAQASRQALG